MRPTHLGLCLLLLSTVVIHAQTSKQSPPEGRITGIVLNDEGQPVAHAYVCATIYEEHGQSQGATTGCHGFSGEDGRFELDHWPMGTLSLFAFKPKDGYADANKRLTAKVTLTPQSPFAAVTVRIGPKAGVLAGSVRDKNTGAPIKNIKLTYVAIDASARGCGSELEISDYAGATFEVTLPTSTDLIVFVSSPSYKPWFYTDTSNGSRPALRLQSGERRSLEIEMEPNDPGTASTNVPPSESPGERAGPPLVSQ